MTPKPTYTVLLSSNRVADDRISARTPLVDGIATLPRLGHHGIG